jgi:hypothetical protein
VAGKNSEISQNLINNFFHRFPYLLFISLPFFAAILKLLYIRRKNFYYSDHAVFTINHYIFSFILQLLIFGANALNQWLRWGIFAWIIFGLFIWWVVYLYKSMRRFYGQSRGKTILKFILLNMLGFLLIQLLFMIFLFLTAYQL